MFYCYSLYGTLCIMLAQFTISPFPVQLHHSQSLPFLFSSLPELFGCVAPVWPQLSTRLCPPNDNEYYVLWGFCCLCLLAEETSLHKSFSVPSRVSSSVRALSIQNVQFLCFQTRKPEKIFGVKHWISDRFYCGSLTHKAIIFHRVELWVKLATKACIHFCCHRSKQFDI